MKRLILSLLLVIGISTATRAQQGLTLYEYTYKDSNLTLKGTNTPDNYHVRSDLKGRKVYFVKKDYTIYETTWDGRILKEYSTKQENGNYSLGIYDWPYWWEPADKWITAKFSKYYFTDGDSQGKLRHNNYILTATRTIAELKPRLYAYTLYEFTYYESQHYNEDETAVMHTSSRADLSQQKIYFVESQGYMYRTRADGTPYKDDIYAIRKGKTTNQLQRYHSQFYVDKSTNMYLASDKSFYRFVDTDAEGNVRHNNYRFTAKREVMTLLEKPDSNPYTLQRATFQGGGITNFYTWLKERLICTSTTSERVLVEVVIDESGAVAVHRVRFIHKSPSGETKYASKPSTPLEKEIISILRQAPKWSPATQDDTPIKDSFRLTITAKYKPRNRDLL
ncbi:MAG: hypothetical protein J6B41_05885 [Alistipes sp.]|nr:hypothetical protein [Alistipes sp.]